jgi:hypothetical protein
VSAHSRGEIELVAGAITASENAPGGVKEPFEAFKARLARIGLGDARILPPMGYWNITYWGEALWVSEEMEQLERKVHTILAPNLDMKDDSDIRRWINTKCDVQFVWTHIWHETDTLVTSDRGILGKAGELADLGATIGDPATAVRELP